MIEGPSGIGKSTAVLTTLRSLGLEGQIPILSSRDPSDLEIISELPNWTDFGTVVIDDFHRLPVDEQNRLADLLKILADTDSRTSKLVVIGINQAGVNLINFAPDLTNRIDRIRFESEPDSKIRELITKGEEALNVSESTTVSVHRIESDSSLDGMLGVDRRAQSLEIADRCPVHCAVRSNVRIHTAAEVGGEVSSTAGIHG